MRDYSQEPPPVKPAFITMKDNHRNIVEIPVGQENMVTIFKAMGYREVQMTEPTEAETPDEPTK